MMTTEKRFHVWIEGSRGSVVQDMGDDDIRWWGRNRAAALAENIGRQLVDISQVGWTRSVLDDGRPRIDITGISLLGSA